MAKSKINMITLMNNAWDRRNEIDAERYEEEVKNLISHSFVEVESMYRDFCANKGYEYKDEVFIVYQHVFVYLMLSDGDFLQGEYDAYCKYCDWAGFKPLTVAETRSLYSRLTSEVIINDLQLLIGLRDSLTPSKYEALVLGFCYLSLLGDKEFDENEYYIIRCFFEVGYDYVPTTWEQFKQEW